MMKKTFMGRNEVGRPRMNLPYAALGRADAFLEANSEKNSLRAYSFEHAIFSFSEKLHSPKHIFLRSFACFHALRRLHRLHRPVARIRKNSNAQCD